MSEHFSPTRRTFLTASAAAGAALAEAPSVLSQNVGDRLNVGLIGCGARGKTLIREVMKLKHNVVALCDIASFRIDELSETVTKADQEKPKEYQDFRNLLEQKGLDAVVIATPDHHHRDQMVASVEAEKDVYVETPLGRTIEDGKDMADVVRRSKRIVQTGHYRRSGPHWKQCWEEIKSNDFGNLLWVKAWDTRNWLKRNPFAVPPTFTREHEKQIDWKAFLGKSAAREFHAERYWSWRWFWDYAGGLLSDVGSAQIDLLHWLSGVEVPKSVAAHGGRYQFKKWETPDVVQGIWDYGTFAAAYHVEFVNGADGAGLAFHGTRMTLIVDSEKDIRLYNSIDRITPDVEPLKKWDVKPELPAHVKNWLDCCISRKEPAASVESAHRSTLAVHLANLSYRTGKRVYWDSDRHEVISS